MFLPLHSVAPEPEPDLSFRLVTHLSFLHHWAAGREIISTFGPWGFLFRGYVFGTNGLLFALNGLLGVLAGFSLWHVLHRVGLFTAIALAFGALGFVASGGPDSRFFAVIALFILAAFSGTGRRLSIGLAVACGLIGLIKFSYFGAAGVAATMSALRDLTNRRRPSAALAYLASIVGWWVLAGQRLSDIPIWIRRSAELAGGYSQGGVLAPPDGLRVDILFAIAALGIVVLVFHLHPAERLLAPALASLGWFLFKSSYVRFDDSHEVNAIAALGFVALTSVPPLLKRSNRPLWVAYFTMAAVGALVGYLPVVLRANTLLKFVSNRSIVLGTSERWLEEARVKRPMQHPDGPADGLHDHQAALIAAGADYRPRPVFQSYLAWTPGLARLNAKHIAGSGGPRFIRVEFAPVDGHLPLMEDGPAWIEIARWYSPDALDGFLVRRNSPVSLKRIAVARWTLRPGERQSFPPYPLLAAKIEVKRSVLGSLYSVLVRDSVRTLTLHFENGARQAYRLTPAAAGGFILSPVMNEDELRSWLRAPRRSVGRRVVGLQIDVTFGTAFGERYSLELDQLILSTTRQ